MRRTVAAVILLAAMAGCSAPPPPEKSPVRFKSESGISSASWGRTPTGTRLEACPLFTGKKRLTVVLAVPSRFRLQDAGGMNCYFGTAKGFESIGVQGNAATTLREHVKKDLKPNEDAGGDDSVSDISYESGVPTFGGRRGEHVEVRCYCDGQDLQSESFRAGGMILSTSIPHEPKPMPKSSLPIVRPTVGVETGVFGIVAHAGIAARYSVTDRIESIMSSEDGVTLYFGGQSYHRIELHVGVKESLAEERTRLSRDPTVSGLVLTDASRAAAGRDGQRLAYGQRFKEYDNSMRVEHVLAFQAGRVRVAVINDGLPDHRQRFRDGIRLLS